MKPRGPESLIRNHSIAVLRISLWLVVGAVILLSLVPPVSRDALVHHLNIPKLYLQAGKIVELPTMPFSYFPMNLDLLYLIPLWMGNDMVPKLIHFAFALFTAGLIHGYLKPSLGKLYGLIGAVFFLSIPIIVKLSITVYVDLGLVFFSTAALLLLFRWMETGFKFRYLGGSAACCGLAMGTKYNGLIVCLILTAFVPWIYSKQQTHLRHRFFTPIGLGLVYVAIAMIIFSPWMIRNWHWKQNPVYPLYNRVFNPPKAPAAATPPQQAPQKTAKGIFSYRSIVYQESEWEMLLLPLRIFFEGEDGSGKHFDGKLNPFLLLFAMMAFMPAGISPRHRDLQGAAPPGPALPDAADMDRRSFPAGQKRLLLVFCVLYFLFALFSTVLRIRYLAPIIPPLVILSVFGMKNGMDLLKTRVGPHQRYAAAGVVLMICLGLNGHYLWTQFKVVDPLSYLTGEVSRDAYITRYRPEYPVMQHANRNLPPDARILFMFMGKRGYYCDRSYQMDSAGRSSLLMDIVIRSNTPEQVASSLRERGFSHLMLQSDIFNRWIDEDFPPGKKELVHAFLGRHTKLLYKHHLYGLLAIAEG